MPLFGIGLPETVEVGLFIFRPVIFNVYGLPLGAESGCLTFKPS